MRSDEDQLLTSKQIKQKAKQGILQFGATKTIAKIANALSFIVVASFLTASEIGIASVVTAIMIIFRSVVRFGISAAIVQAKQFTNEQAYSTFWFCIAWAGCLVVLLGLSAHWIEHYYEIESLGSLIMIGSLQLIFSSSGTVPEMILERKLEFKSLAVFDTLGVISSIVTKLTLAILGAGALSLILAPVVQEFLIATLVFINIRFRPKLFFKWSIVKGLIQFGSQIAVMGVTHNLQQKIDYLIIGKMLGEEILGLYRVGSEIILGPLKSITDLFNRTLYPAYARLQADPPKQITFFYSSSQSLLLVLIPISAFLFVNAEEVLNLFYGDKFGPSFLVVQFFAVIGLQRFLSRLIPRLINAVGRPDLNIRYALFSVLLLASGFSIAFYFWGQEYQILSICLTWLTCYPIIYYYLLRQAKKDHRAIDVDLPAFTCCRRLSVVVSWVWLCMPSSGCKYFNRTPLIYLSLLLLA